MGGERDLGRLLATLDPELRPGRYVFAVAPAACAPAGVQPVATVREAEGLTVVLTQEEADRAGLTYDVVLAMITLRVHSSLEAVGMTAAFSAALAAAGVSANVVAGLHHDHVFVPAAHGERAVELLRALAASAASA